MVDLHLRCAQRMRHGRFPGNWSSINIQRVHRKSAPRTFWKDASISGSANANIFTLIMHGMIALIGHTIGDCGSLVDKIRVYLMLMIWKS
jgi:hypothetical protein